MPGKMIKKISDEGFVPPLRRRLNWYWSRLRVNNRNIGWIIETFGNRVFLDGLRYSVDCPLISTGHKSTILFGLHEIEERELAKAWISPDIPVVEFGGGLGAVSCLINSRLSKGLPHIVVEANPAMIPVLKRNKMLNGCDFHLLNNALGYDEDYIQLNIDKEFVGSSALNTANSETVKVKTTTLNSLLKEAGLSQVQVICDIEGLERDLIRREILDNERVVALLVEMHPRILGVSEVETLIEELENSGLCLTQTIGDVSFFKRK